MVEVTGQSPRALGPLGGVALDANTGALLSTQLPGNRDANHAAIASVFALHFGEYGNAWVKALYFVMGLGGAFLFYSGNLLWVESRRKRRQAQQGRAPLNLARATVGACIGACVAVSVAFVATQLLEGMAASRQIDVASGISWACFGSWVLSCCGRHCAGRFAPPVNCWAAAVTTLLVPVAHGAVTGWWLWRSAAAGHWSLFCIDAGALAMAAGFAALARATDRRARLGDPNSVWSL